MTERASVRVNRDSEQKVNGAGAKNKAGTYLSHHSHLAMQIVADLCADVPARWQEATDWAVRGLEARIGLWDAVCERVSVVG